MAYGRNQQLAMAALATAERYLLLRRPREALGQAKRALKGLPHATPAHLRAQDLEFLAEQQLKRKRRR